MRVLVIVLCVVAACGGSDDAGECEDGETRACYSGPPGTEGVGSCAGGTETCSNGKFSGICVGDVTPFVEHCDGQDEDCSGIADDVEGAGAGCMSADNCDGVIACAGAELACVAPLRNECDVCGGPVVPDVGQTCNNGACPGTLACNAGGDGSECNAPAANECDVCGGPAVTGLGDACSSADGCPGEIACNTTGDAGECNAPAKNECALCGGPSVPDLGDACANGTCTGTRVCNATNDASECNAPAANACGLCGGPVVTGVGDACSANGCNGVLACNGAGDGTTCSTPPVGVACTGARGCVGASACDAGGAPICRLDDPCVHVVISELATGSSVCVTDEFVELYNPTSRDVALAGYTLRFQASTGNFSRLVLFPANTTLRARGYLLVASSRATNPACPTGYVGLAKNTVTPDFTFAAQQLGAGAGQIWLTTTDANPTSPADAIVVDLVGYGTAISFEGAAASAPPVDGSIERKANAGSTATSMATGADRAAGNAFDSDSNSTDFVVQAVREPQNAASAGEP